MEGNVGEAPSRRFPGISTRRVETCGGIVSWSSLGGGVWFPFCFLAFLAFRLGGGGVWGLPPLASQPGCRAVAKRLPNAHPADPRGIGPEIVAKALADERVRSAARF